METQVPTIRSLERQVSTSFVPQKSFLKKSVRILINSFAIIAMLMYAYVMFGVKTESYRFVPILTNSMSPSMPKDSLAYATPVKTADLKVGDVLVFQQPGNSSKLMAHRIAHIEIKEKSFLFRTKGDNNPGGDPWHFEIRDKTAWIVSQSVSSVGGIETKIINAGFSNILLNLGIGLAMLLGLHFIWKLPSSENMILNDEEKLHYENLAKLRSITIKIATAFVIIGVIISIVSPNAWSVFSAGSNTSFDNPVFTSATINSVSAPSCTWGSSTSALTFNWSNATEGKQNNTQIKRATTSGGATSVVQNYAVPLETGSDTPPVKTTEYFYKLAASRTSTSWTSSDTTELRSDRCTNSIDTFAGTGTIGSAGDGGQATSATINLPRGVDADAQGNVYFADTINGKIRKVDTSGVITTVAGGGAALANSAADCNLNASALSANLTTPSDVAVAPNGDFYIATTGDQCIQKVSGGIISKIAGTGVAGSTGDGGIATSAALSSPQGLAVNNSFLYISDTTNAKIRRIDFSTGIISTVVGGGTNTVCTYTGSGITTSLSSPLGIELDSSGNLYIADSGRACVRKLSGTTITQIAGGGSNVAPNNTCAFSGLATSIVLVTPADVVVDSNGTIYISSKGRHCVHEINSGNISKVAGTGTSSTTGDNGPSAAATLTTPWGLALTNGNLVFAQNLTSPNSRLRIVYGVQ